jgi:hypothetical protein
MVQTGLLNISEIVKFPLLEKVAVFECFLGFFFCEHFVYISQVQFTLNFRQVRWRHYFVLNVLPVYRKEEYVVLDVFGSIRSRPQSFFRLLKSIKGYLHFVSKETLEDHGRPLRI